MLTLCEWWIDGLCPIELARRSRRSCHEWIEATSMTARGFLNYFHISVVIVVIRCSTGTKCVEIFKKFSQTCSANVKSSIPIAPTAISSGIDGVNLPDQLYVELASLEFCDSLSEVVIHVFLLQHNQHQQIYGRFASVNKLCQQKPQNHEFSVTFCDKGIFHA